MLEHLEIGDAEVRPSHMHPDGTLVTQRKHHLTNFVAGRVCKRCNNGWMSQLEERAKPLLTLLIDGEREVVHLTEPERHIVATWAFKTAIVLNNASNYHANVPPEHFRALFLDRSHPADGVTVFGQQHHGTRRFYWIQNSVWRFFSDSPVNEESLRETNEGSYKISLQLGKLLLLVAFWPTDEWQMVVWAGIHIPLYPTRGPAAWFEGNPLPDDFSWYDSMRAQIEFHVTPSLRRAGALG